MLSSQKAIFLPLEAANDAYPRRSAKKKYFARMAGSGHIPAANMLTKTLGLSAAVYESGTSGIQRAVVVYMR